MKRNILNVGLVGCLVASSLMIGGCDNNFDDYNTNPNESTIVTSSMLATNLILEIMQEHGTDKGFMRDDMLNKYIAWTEENDIDYAFNKLGRQSFSSMTVLYNVDKMVNFAATDGLKKSYEGLGHVMRAYKFFDMTMRLGDIPYSEAMQGEAGVEYPKYDTQKEVFVGILNELEEADQLFQNGTDFEGDPVYGGSCAKWRKAANVLELKVLINLYKKTSESDLKVKERFQSIVSNKPIFESNADNLQLVHSDNTGQKYPFYKEGNNYLAFIQMSSEVVDSLKKFGDRRLFYYAKPTKNAVTQGLAVTDWNSYNGVEPTMIFSDIQAAVQSGSVSQPNARYYELPVSEPTYLLSYAEMKFILAEAVVRGLINGNAKSYYEDGIRASMTFTADNTPDNVEYNHGMKITSDYINTYLQGSGVVFGNSSERQIEQIIEQKYLSTFFQIPFNAFYEYRRTGYPVFPINPKSNRNNDTSKMPVRWMYSQDEYDYNTENVNAAVKSQYGGSDDENQIMWLLK